MALLLIAIFSVARFALPPQSDIERPRVQMRTCVPSHYKQGPSNDVRDKLIRAITRCDVEQVQSLLSAGLNPNYARSNEMVQEELTPLRYAFMSNFRPAITELIKHGADVNLPDADGEGVMTSAASIGDVEVLREVLKAGGNVESRDNGGDFPLDLAAGSGNIEAVKELISAGAKVNNSTVHAGVTPLISAASRLHLQTVKILLAAGADACKRDKDGHTARDAALHPLSAEPDAQRQAVVLEALPEHCRD